MGAYITVTTTSKGERRFSVRYRRGGRYFPVERAGTFRTRRDAETRRRAVAEWLAAGLDPRVELNRAVSPTITVRELSQEWLASKRRIRPATRTLYEGCVARVNDRFGDRPVEALGYRDVNEWIAVLQERLEPSTIGTTLRVLRQMLDHRDGVNVARDRRVEAPRAQRREPDPPDAEQVLGMLERVDPGSLSFLVLLERTGMRVGEALALEPDDVAEGRVRVRAEAAKANRARWVEVPEWLEFTVPSVTRGGLWNRMRDACDDAGVTRFGPHQLRHRRASLWHQQGVVAAELARRLGHSRPSISLDVYSHVKPLREIPDHDLASLLR